MKILKKLSRWCKSKYWFKWSKILCHPDAWVLKKYRHRRFHTQITKNFFLHYANERKMSRQRIASLTFWSPQECCSSSTAESKRNWKIEPIVVHLEISTRANIQIISGSQRVKVPAKSCERQPESVLYFTTVLEDCSEQLLLVVHHESSFAEPQSFLTLQWVSGSCNLNSCVFSSLKLKRLTRLEQAFKSWERLIGLPVPKNSKKFLLSIWQKKCKA